LAYTFYDTPETVKSGFNIDVAEIWQQYLLGFVLESDPNHLSPVVRIPKYGEASLVVQFNQTGANIVKDPYQSSLCDVFWPMIWRTYGTFPKSGKDQGPSRELKHENSKAPKHDVSGSKKPGPKGLVKEIAQDILLGWEQDELK